MAITAAIVHVADVARSLALYRDLFGGRLLAEPTADAADLDFVTATIRLRRRGARPSTWQEDDLQTGFRHIGFKVADAEGMAATLQRAGVPFRAGLSDHGIGVRTAFFFDPDGTVLEIIEGFVDYHRVHDDGEVAAERAAGAPARPRFDHVATTTPRRDATVEAWAAAGFVPIGALEPVDDPRGFRIDYLRDRGTIVEVFSFAATTFDTAPDPDALGFHAVEIDGAVPLPGGEPLQRDDDRQVWAGADRLAYTAAGA